MTIRTDASRLRIPTQDRRLARAVAPRQGQVLLDTDIAQGAELALRRIEQDTRDSYGTPDRFVVPNASGGFKIAKRFGTVQLTKGHGYVNGRLVERFANAGLQFLSVPPDESIFDEPSMAVIKTVERFVDPVEDEVLADKALGDAEASGRLVLDWQLLALRMPDDTTCAESANILWNRGVSRKSSLSLEVMLDAGNVSNDPCSLLPDGGYTGLENRLYRVEVHGGTPLKNDYEAHGPHFKAEGLQLKISHMNASLLARIVGRSGLELTVTPPARDPRRWFAPGQYAEIVTPADDLDPSRAAANQRLFAIASVTDDTVTLAASDADLDATGTDPNGDWYLRLWDRLPDGRGVAVMGGIVVDDKSEPVEIGDGLSVRLYGSSSDFVRRGDYWTFTARADGTIDWPEGQERVPDGPQVDFAPLALLNMAEGPDIQDCRIQSAQLTDPSLVYLGGDGQSVVFDPDDQSPELPTPFRLAVMRGKTPVTNEEVHFYVPNDAPPVRLNGQEVAPGNAYTARTDNDGIVSVRCELFRDAYKEPVRVRAYVNSTSTDDLIFEFNAKFDHARLVGLSPVNESKCPKLVGVKDVQTAIETLCEALGQDAPAVELPRIMYADWSNDNAMTTTRFINDGLHVRFSETLHPACLDYPHACHVTLRLREQSEEPPGVHFREIYIPGALETEDKDNPFDLRFKPFHGHVSEKDKLPYLNHLVDRYGSYWFGETRGLRCDIRLASAGLYTKVEDGTEPKPLNGAVHLNFGQTTPPTHNFIRNEMGLFPPGPSRDASDFTSWFFLVTENEG